MNKIRNLKFFGLVCILAFALVFIGFHLLQAQGKAKDKPKPPPQELLLLQSGDIVTTGSNALRVWRWQDPSLEPIWSTETPGYSSVAVGDADNDIETREIVVPEYKEVKVGKGKSAQSYFKFFLNVYKEGEIGIWHSTEEYAYVKEERWSFVEVLIADVDLDPGNEVILLTYHNLAVFKYLEDKDNFQIVKLIKPSDFVVPQKKFQSVTVWDIDENPYDNEILVSSYATVAPNVEVSYLFKIDIDDGSPIKLLTFIDGFLGHRSLRAADLDGDGSLEICSTGIGCRGRDDTGVLWQAYAFVWDFDGDIWQCKSHVIPGWEDPVNMFPYLHLDVGMLNDTERIVVSANSGYSDYYLYLYNYDGSDLSLSYPSDGGFGLLLPDARVSDVEIGNVNDDVYNEIVVAGNARFRGKTVFYLELFDPDLTSLWKRIGERKEGTVIDTAIVK